MYDFNIIVKLGEIPTYVRITDEKTDTFEFVTNIKDASLFTDNTSESLNFYLKLVRNTYPQDKFSTSFIAEKLLDKPLKNMIQHNKPHLV